MPKTALIRLVIADDHPVYRKGLIAMIKTVTSSNIQVVGEACNGQELISEVEKNKPDVAITDIRMPILTGIDACRIICKSFLSTAVIALSMLTDCDSVFEMFKYGAKGYLNKSSNVEEVVRAVNVVHSGELYYTSEASTELVKKIGPNKFHQLSKYSTVRLSTKEIELIKLVCMQLTFKEIADKMNISQRTAEEYSRNIREKIEAKNVVGIALYALKNNIVTPDEINI